MIGQYKSWSSLPGLCPANTVFLAEVKDVDGRDKPGHDEREVSDAAEELR